MGWRGFAVLSLCPWPPAARCPLPSPHFAGKEGGSGEKHLLPCVLLGNRVPFCWKERIVLPFGTGNRTGQAGQ